MRNELDRIDRGEEALLNMTPSLEERATAAHMETLPSLPEPQPLVAEVAPVPYPLDALPQVMREAVEELQGFVKCPVSMVASSALATLSLAGQSLAAVERTTGLVGPVGIYLLTIAESGERKSTVDRFFKAAILDFEKAEREKAKPLIDRYKYESSVWESKHSGLLDKLRAAAKGGKATQQIEQEIKSLLDDQPQPPKVPRLLYGDTTTEALASNIAKVWPSCGLFSGEAGTVLGGHSMSSDAVMRTLAFYNQLWDGSPFTIDRKGDGAITVDGRCTVWLQTQSEALNEFMLKNGILARNTGFFARFLVDRPVSTQGNRPFVETPSMPKLAAFNRRIAQLLNEPMSIAEDGTQCPMLLKFSPEAKTLWVEHYNEVERGIKANGELASIRDCASKSADNVARIAALFQLFMGRDVISAEAVEGASRIAAWHLKESLRLLGGGGTSSVMIDAQLLDDWLIKHFKNGHTSRKSFTELQQGGPSRLRRKDRLEPAVDVLCNLKRVRVVTIDGRKCIEINPALLGG
jgi:putative DNA primase/helicase